VNVLVGGAEAAARLGRVAADPAVCGAEGDAGDVLVDHADDRDEAIVLHTSGSSGVPKGVPVSHAGVTAFVDWMVREFDVRTGDAVAALASPTFDQALFEQLAPLCAGGTILRPDERASLSARKLVTFLHAGGVSCIYAVPSLYVRLLAAGSLPPLAALRTVLFAGEAFPLRPLRELRAALPGRSFANLFGPTETNVLAFHRLADDEPGDDPK
jgi:non-ribosomal peptide synthetase component F